MTAAIAGAAQTPVMIALVAFLMVGVGFAAEASWRRRQRLHGRLDEVANRRRVAGAKRSIRRSGDFKVWLATTSQAVLPIVPARDRVRTRELLDSAGLRDPGDVAKFFGIKTFGFVLGGVSTVGLVLWQHDVFDGIFRQCVAIVVGALLGNLLPEASVRMMRRRRQNRVRSSLANAIDLMIITANAGQSLDVTLIRVAKEIERMAPELAEEFKVTTSELQALPNRRDALENLASRTGVAEMRSLTATLIQTIRYGTPLSQALKTIAQELRQARLLLLEERAAKLPALLSLPLMLLIMPAVFIVTAGPAVLNLVDAFSN